MEPLTAFFDANILYPATLRDFLMRLALRGLFQAKWSAMVHAEWMENVLKNRPDLTREQINRTRQLMDAHVPNSLVTGFEYLIDELELPDKNDRHVLAAAIEGQADVIVTFNLKDFPQERLHPYDIEAQHPDTFVSQLISIQENEVVAVCVEHRSQLKNPPKSASAYLDSLERQGLTLTISKLRKFEAFI